MKKQILIGIITGTLLLAGCGDALTNNNALLPTDSGNEMVTSGLTDNDVSVKNLDEITYETVGEVIQIEGDQLHVLTGDVVEIFTVLKSDSDNIYLGETVSITKETEEMYSVMSFKLDDFKTRYTNTGDMIERVEVILTVIDDESLIFSANEVLYTFNKNDQELILGESYVIDLLDYGNGEHFIIDLFNINNILDLTIDEINRNDNGEMIIRASDSTGGQYLIPTYSAVKNFNLSELTSGQMIQVYPTMILESFPAQIKTNRIDLLSEVPQGTTSLDYDVLGEVVLIEDNNVHILSGDMIQIFTLTKTQLELIYLGETVKLYEEDQQLLIEPYIVEDFKSYFTTMGQRVENMTGTITSIEEENPSLITIESDENTFICLYYGSEVLELHTIYEFDLVNFTPDETTIFAVFKPQSIIEMTITGLYRTDNGELMLKTIDQNGGEYNLATSTPRKNFNLSELQVGDTLLVYADEIMESWPMQVNTRKIIKK